VKRGLIDRRGGANFGWFPLLETRPGVQIRARERSFLTARDWAPSEFGRPVRLVDISPTNISSDFSSSAQSG
jgi:hypothetical protein